MKQTVRSLSTADGLTGLSFCDRELRMIGALQMGIIPCILSEVDLEMPAVRLMMENGGRWKGLFPREYYRTVPEL